MATGKDLRRRVWRMTAGSPLGEFVDVEPTSDGQVPPAMDIDLNVAPAKTLYLASGGGDWRRSSYDLLMGLKTRDVSDTIPDRMFEKLFRPREDR